MAAQCAAGNVDHPEYLLRLAQLELIATATNSWWSVGSGRHAFPP